MNKLNHYHILLVDDEFYLRQSLKRQFEELKSEFRITAEAQNGKEALDILKEKDIQMVITDIRMPVMDGIELSARIHDLYPDILTVILSGYSDFEYARSAIQNGVFDYLLKPVEAEELESTLSKARMKLQKLYALQEETLSGGIGPEESVKIAIQFMHEHYMEDLDMASLASSLGFHSAYLTRLFNRYAGDSPLKYLTNIRIHEAKRLLTDSSLSISRVGELVGYPDQFHFSKTFRKATGMNPTAYRKQVASGDEPRNE